MNEWVQAMGWSGIFAPVALGAIGSVMGCAIAGQAAIGTRLPHPALLVKFDVESTNGHRY